MSITFCPSGVGHCEEGINLSNANAMALMSVLGVEPDYCGIISSAELISRIDAVNSASIGAAVVEPSIDRTPGHATMICCGRSREYLEERLQQLRDLATQYPGDISWA